MTSPTTTPSPEASADPASVAPTGAPPIPSPDDERQSWWTVLAAVRRARVVFVAVAAAGLVAAVALHDTGAEYVAVAEVLAVAPPGANTLVDSSRRHYDSLAGVVEVELESDAYHRQVFPVGADGVITVDYTSNWPVVLVQVRAADRDVAIDVITRAATDFVTIVADQQESRGVVPVARLRAEIGAIHVPPPRPAGSRRALVALIGAALFIAAAAARATDRLGLVGR